MSSAGGVYPRWHPDGHSLFYLAPDMQLMSVPLETAGASGEASPGMPEALFETRIATTGPYVFTAGIFAKAQYAVAADGRLLMNVADDALASPIMVVLNWPAALRR